MHRFTLLLTTLAVALAALLASPSVASAQSPAFRPMPERLVVLGFTAGQLTPLRLTLQDKGLINEEGDWIGGTAHYLQLGDVLLFGQEVLESLELLHRLSQQAAAAGGDVTIVLGPSLYMALRQDIANIPRENYERFATEDSQAKLDAQVKKLGDQLWEFNADFDEPERQRLRERWEELYRRTHALGAMEFLERIGPTTALGAWLRAAPAVVRYGGLVFSNGGISEDYSKTPLEELNRRILEDATKDSVWVPKMADTKSPIWWKELSTEREDALIPRVENILRNLGADALVVAHSPALGESMKRSGRVYHIQSGLAPDASREAMIATLEITPDRWTFTVGGRRFVTEPPAPLPRPDNDGVDDAG